MISAFLFFYSSCPRPRSRTKRSATTRTKIICCFLLLQTTYTKEMKAGSTGPALPYRQVSFLNPIYTCRPTSYHSRSN